MRAVGVRQARTGAPGRAMVERLRIDRFEAAQRVRRHAFVWDVCAVQVGMPVGFFLGLMAMVGEPATTAVSYWRGSVLVAVGIAVGMAAGYVVGRVLWGVDGWWHGG